MREGMPETQAELEEMLNSAVETKTGDAVKQAIREVYARSGAKRLPDVTDYNPDAPGAREDGKWKSRGEFWQKL